MLNGHSRSAWWTGSFPEAPRALTSLSQPRCFSWLHPQLSSSNIQLTSIDKTLPPVANRLVPKSETPCDSGSRMKHSIFGSISRRPSGSIVALRTLFWPLRLELALEFSGPFFISITRPPVEGILASYPNTTLEKLLHGLPCCCLLHLRVTSSASPVALLKWVQLWAH